MKYTLLFKCLYRYSLEGKDTAKLLPQKKYCMATFILFFVPDEKMPQALAI
jgi:hypothetical protein